METIDNIESKLGIVKDLRLFTKEALTEATLEPDFEAAFESIAKEKPYSEIIIVADGVGEDRAHQIEALAKEKGLRATVVDTEKDAEVYRKQFEQETVFRAPDRSIEEVMKKLEYEKIEPYEMEHRRDIKEQMKQRSRFLSKHCRK